MFDTGSGVIYAISDLCGQCTEQGIYKMKRNKEGKTLINTQVKYGSFVTKEQPIGIVGSDRYELSYGSGFISGYKSYEKMCFSQSEEDTNCIKQTQIIFADFATDSEQDKFGALIGLAPKANENQLVSFLSQLRGERGAPKQTLNEVFSIYLSSVQSEPGYITFGGYDLQKYSKDKELFWTKASPTENLWVAGMFNVSLGKDFNLQEDTRSLIFDTGVSYVLVPKKDFQTVNEQLEKIGVTCMKQDSAKALTSPRLCSVKDYEKVPDLRFTI